MSLSPHIRVNGIAPGPTMKNKRQTEKHFKKHTWLHLLKDKLMLKKLMRLTFIKIDLLPDKFWQLIVVKIELANTRHNEAKSEKNNLK